MTSNARWGLGILLAAPALAIVACGGDEAASGGQGGAGAAGGATSAATTTLTMTTTTSATGAGGSGGAGHHSFETAADIALNGYPSEGTLPDPTSSRDFYKFSGNEGDRVGILGDAKPDYPNPFDPTYLDLVITLYDTNQKQIARNDDPWPKDRNDPEIFTYLPSTGTYYIVVEECASAFGPTTCLPASAITHHDYSVQVLNYVASATNGVTIAKDESGAAHTDDDTTSPNKVKYDKNDPDQYVLSYLSGTFIDGADVDVYSFTPPADADVDPGERAQARFWILPSGTDGNGSTTSPGLVWITDSNASLTKLAQIDATLYGNITETNIPAELTVPVTAGHLYYLFVQHPPAPAGNNDFYFVKHFVHGVYQVEAEASAPNTNDTSLTAEPLADPEDSDDGSVAYYIEGDLGAADPADFFAVTATAFTKARSTCYGQRLGSALRSLTFELLAGDAAAPAQLGSATEAANTMRSIPDKTISDPSKPVFLKLTSGALDAEVASAHYRCVIVLSP
jgi:hypothetical protein